MRSKLEAYFLNLLYKESLSRKWLLTWPKSYYNTMPHLVSSVTAVSTESCKTFSIHNLLPCSTSQISQVKGTRGIVYSGWQAHSPAKKEFKY